VVAVLGVNAVFHDPAAALVVDGHIVAAAEEERFTRRKHGKEAVPFSAWELPVQAARWCLAEGGITAAELDGVSYSYDAALALDDGAPGADATWEHLRTMYAGRAASFLTTVLPGLRPDSVRFVPHHVAHAASAYLPAPFPDAAFMVLDGRGEASSYLAGHNTGGTLETLASQPLPHSLGLLYEDVTAHLGFRRSSDEYKVMALAAFGDPSTFRTVFRDHVYPTEDGGFRTEPLALGDLVPARPAATTIEPAHADLAAALQERLEEMVLGLGRWVHAACGATDLAMAGGVALNCVANSRLAAEGPFERIWVQPAAGDAGTALGGALFVATAMGDRCHPMAGADLGRGWTDAEIEACLRDADWPYERPVDMAATVADALVDDGVVGWFQGRSEFGPRALGHRSLLVDPRREANLQRMNAVKGREEFRPVAPMVLVERAAEIFAGPIPSPYMLFVHDVRPDWRPRIPAAVHVDGTARAQTVDRDDEPLVAALLDAFDRRTGVPVLINTSFNTAGRPMVDHPRDALECFGSGPIDVLAMGPFVVRRRFGATR
jgi:carbamoyltransferase